MLESSPQPTTSQTQVAVGDWVWDSGHQTYGRIVELIKAWGDDLARLWLPEKEVTVLVATGRLIPLAASPPLDATRLGYISAAARVAAALSEDVLLAPIEAAVIPLPHQIRALSRVMAKSRIRYLLADEVGLGKTIEAGLILRELKLRGLVRRTVVVVPKGLVTQWVAEMHTHFGEEFRAIIPGDFAAYRRVAGGANPWRLHDQIVCPLDSVKPLDKRRGWSPEEVAEHNRDRFEDLVAAGWDLIIVDEAHRLSGSTDQVARYKLGVTLAEAAPYLLLLTATPHQGKTDAFYRLVALLDSSAFPDSNSVTRERVQPYVIRTEKRRAIDDQGRPLFTPRVTKLAPVAWGLQHRFQRVLYEGVSSYVRDGYNQALKEKKTYVGFLLLLMQRLVTSSTRAIRTALERRLEVLQAPEPEEQLTLFPVSSQDEWAELDGQEQIDTLLQFHLKALKNERAEVELLLDAAKRTEAAAADAKAEALLEWLYKLQQEEGEPDLKVLIFTEFVPTQTMLAEFLTARGFSVACLNGSLDMESRERVQHEFAGTTRVLVSTDAGGEGLNLQFCHVVVNYDIPWNPMRLEQRIGRVDRIGQRHSVRAINLILEGTVEYRVREVLEEKLAVILQEFGADKTGDVLDSVESAEIFDSLYRDAILDPNAAIARVDQVIQRVRDSAKALRESGSILGDGGDLDADAAQRLMAHPLPRWVEQMTVNYVAAHGGNAMRRSGVWDLTWPDGSESRSVVFSAKDAEGAPAARHLALEDPRVRGLALSVPRFAPGAPVPILGLPGIPPEVTGLWSLWRVALHGGGPAQYRIMALFIHDDARPLLPTARRVWDVLLTDRYEPANHLVGSEALTAFDRAKAAAEAEGRLLYEELTYRHRETLRQERENGEYAFSARRKIIERVGLPKVRIHRLGQLAKEQDEWRREMESRGGVSPELVPLVVVRVEGAPPHA